MFIIDDPMLALITRFGCGEGQLQLQEGEFMLDQIATIQRYVAQFPVEQWNTRAIEWIEAHAERYRQAWQNKVVYVRATQTRCPDCPLTEEGLTSHCEIHHRWLDLLNSYIAGEVSSRRYVEDTLRLLTDYKARLKVTAIGRTPWESLIEFNQIIACSIERVTQQEIAFAGDYAATAIHHLQALTGMKDVQNVLMDVTRLATECGEKWIANTHRVLAILLQAQNELGRWLNGHPPLLVRAGSEDWSTSAAGVATGGLAPRGRTQLHSVDGHVGARGLRLGNRDCTLYCAVHSHPFHTVSARRRRRLVP
jgi:hypothetical protein